jgi:hypothetical protein
MNFSLIDFTLMNKFYIGTLTTLLTSAFFYYSYYKDTKHTKDTTEATDTKEDFNKELLHLDGLIIQLDSLENMISELQDQLTLN